jgi:hypothetical protein
VAVPGATPVTTPDDDAADAISVALLLHVPPPGVSLNIRVEPTHTLNRPMIVPGNGFTVTTVVFVTEQPEPDALIVSV